MGFQLQQKDKDVVVETSCAFASCSK